MGTDIERFKSDIKTGFRELDRLSGGLYPGVYCIGAISSLGKTTFTHQIADQIAAANIQMARVEAEIPFVLLLLVLELCLCHIASVHRLRLHCSRS